MDSWLRARRPRAALALLGLLLWAVAPALVARRDRVQFVFVSDLHYGLTRPAFRGGTDVSARVVNQAMAAAVRALPARSLPADDGVGAGTRVGALDFVAVGGDVVNRQELDRGHMVQPAAASWAEFEADYLRTPGRVPVFVVPGNHDLSNALGYPRPLTPARDATAAAAIFRLMMRPAVGMAPITPATFDAATRRVRFSRDIGGVHLQFLSIWPDSTMRAWMAEDLARVPAGRPTLVVVHDPPEGEARHFRNPNPPGDINATDRFENLLDDTFADGTTTEGPATREAAAFEQFAAGHAAIRGYFHGHTNWNQFYDFRGPGGTAALPTFRVDSPMKGEVSGADPRKLSFQLVTIDARAGRMTVRECLWNADDAAGAVSNTVRWGESRTVSLTPGRETR